MNNFCPYCGQYHGLGVCPKIRAIEYYSDGSIRKIEFKDGSVQGYGSLNTVVSIQDDLFESMPEIPSGPL
jgi:hypothetical protein